MSAIPENFKSIIIEFIEDLTKTFPEHQKILDKWRTCDENQVNFLFDHCLTVYPERFFDILYQNDDIFDEKNEVNTFFFPEIDFKIFYNCDGISENTKKTIWKYLQLMLFTIIGSVKDKNDFGETMNIFEGINEEELQEKLNDTFVGMEDFFKNLNENMMDGGVKPTSFPMEDCDNSTEGDPPVNETTDDPENENKKQQFTFDNNIPSMEQIQEHLKDLFNGKIGKLAKELAEEISEDFTKDLSENASNMKSSKDVLEKMIKNPKKMIDLVKKVGDKIKNKMESGEITKEEMMKETTDIIKKMKEMGGNKGFNDIVKNLSKSMGGGKIDMNSINRMTKQSAMKERMQNKLKMKNSSNPDFSIEKKDEQDENNETYVYKTNEEKQERTAIYQKPVLTDEQLIAEFENMNVSSTKKKQKKNKK